LVVVSTFTSVFDSEPPPPHAVNTLAQNSPRAPRLEIDPIIRVLLSIPQIAGAASACGPRRCARIPNDGAILFRAPIEAKP
jgi:hypothetical protein